MLSTVFQALTKPHYPRRYVGRHRARFAIRIIIPGRSSLP
jgi:hypothetical protein